MKIRLALLAVPLLVSAARAGDEAPNVRALTHDLAVAEHRLEQARLDVKAQDLSADASVAQATAELELSKARLEKFDQLDAPNRRAKAELDLRSSKDRATEAADELKQIELMYKEQDLNDMTAEFVVARGRRNAERAAARIAIQEKEHDALANHLLPLERKQLALDVEKKRVALERSKLDAVSGALGKRIGLMKAEGDIVKLRERIEEAKKAPEKAAAAAAAAAKEAAPRVREW